MYLCVKKNEKGYFFQAGQSAQSCHLAESSFRLWKYMYAVFVERGMLFIILLKRCEKG